MESQGGTGKDPERLVKQRAKRYQFRRFLFGGNSAGDECDVNAGLGIPQQRRTLSGSGRRYEFEANAFAKQYLLIAFDQFGIQAAFRIDRHDNCSLWLRAHESHSCPDDQRAKGRECDKRK